MFSLSILITTILIVQAFTIVVRSTALPPKPLFPAYNADVANSTVLFAAAAYCLWTVNTTWSDGCYACTQATQSESMLRKFHGIDNEYGYSVVDHERKQIILAYRG